MKAVSLLTMLAAVGVLGAAIFFMAGQKNSVGLGVKASSNKTVSGEVVSKDPDGCAKSFYLGCYKLTTSGVTYDLVEDVGAPSLSLYVGKKVRLTGKQANIQKKNVLMVTAVSITP